LGRAHGCDIQLDSPEVSGLHCILTRGRGELLIRDCNSRVGVRVNGAKVREVALRNGDVVQIGTFSFDVYLPWGALPPEVDKDPLEIHKRRIAVLERKRDRLARLALKLRRQLRDRSGQEDTKQIRVDSERPTLHDRPAETFADRPAAGV
jgi:pSer/pThr/pTyr-binding forkhead associated (FHA) protein